MTTQVSHQDAGQAFEELKKTIESKTAHLSESKEKIEKINATLDKYEEKNQALVKELEARKIAEIEMKEKISSMEKELVRIPAGKAAGEAEKEKLEMKQALDIFFRKTDNQKTAKELEIERKYLRTDSDPSGGYLTPPDYFNEILKKITEISPVRSVARIVKTSRESILIPVRETIVQGNWVGEGVDFTVNNSKYGNRDLKVNTLSVSSEVTIQMLQDSVFNVEEQVNSDISESFAATEGAAFVVGDGINKPEGLLAKAGASDGPQVINSGIANSFDGDSLILMAGELKTGYDPKYMLNRRTLAKVRTFKDGLGQYIWTPGLANNYPSLINGYPYVNAIDVPDIASNDYPVIFGDFYRGYVIADHVYMYVIRDNYTQSAKGKVVFNALRRVGGMMVLAEAIKVLKCST
jgi:HK97 family phage major capsid protein